MLRYLLCFLLPLLIALSLVANPEAAHPEGTASKFTTDPRAPAAAAPETSVAPNPQTEPAILAADDTAAAPQAAAEPATAAEEDEEEEMIGDLFSLGQQLFETFAPEEIKERYRFPTREDWDEFAARLERALQANSFAALAEMEDDARAALVALRALPDYADYADWLEERLDDIGMAQQLETAQREARQPLAGVSPKPPRHTPKTPDPAADSATPKSDEPRAAVGPVVPLYDVWLERMRRRPPPVRAATFVPRLKPVFHEAEVPAALVWLAETESSFNPAARSPVGARGLFQLMPGTAKDLGLRLFPFDERLDPLKSAHSAARYLNRLYQRFEDWPLALAAYNAGPNRVSRILKEQQAKTFAEIADTLPAETRLYVPKVLATVAVREGVTLEALTAASAPRLTARTLARSPLRTSASE